MKLYNNEQWVADIDEVISVVPELNELMGCKVMITGSTGLICSAVVDVLARWNATHVEKIGIIATGRNETGVSSRFSYLINEPWFEVMAYDAVFPVLPKDFSCNYIIHGGGNASPNKIVSEPVETMMGNFLGTQCLLEYAREYSLKRLLYISSSEVYGHSEGGKPFKIYDYGYVDLLQPRSSYALGKRAAETLCVSYGAEWGVDSVIVRPGHIYGPTARESDNRVSSVWAYAAARGEDIVMKSNGAQIRSYCYVLDCVTAILKVLLRGKSMNAYNISNPDAVISIKQLAELLTQVGDCSLRIELPSETDKKGFNPMLNSSLDASELMALGWRGRFDAPKGISHTVDILRSILSTRNV
ncbi:MAG: NAD-dependent epimerase/dehydratase family protein [Selenomonas ruminantium]|jgi:nucleoside-diphosphate-sugar epimerase|uniref:NAD-dependent epimerase/dehydratase family protein n=1 Tax=Selenomonas ruminantium TaxID=971 RepID=A0A927WK63_SELRU|nr:NAD-dependent epimerase/dehydratase family protein [Selenomonas ruminantium]MBE6085489.1 NAD-dependent epimerase/dehydratase family protein [Selenomonas ruminantium]